MTSLALLALVAAGCAKHAVTTVKGKVTFGNQPVEQGTVYFVASDNAKGQAALGDGGVYTMTDAPVGEVRIGVEIPPRPVPVGGADTQPTPGEVKDHPMGAPRGPDPNKWMPIPDEFKDYTKSGLKWTVPDGGGDHDIQLGK
jgi:hypothetical protein